MLSILIPVYNFDVRALVTILHRQAEKENIPFEIIIIDDHSEKKFRDVNREILSFSNLQYILLESNIGRSAIRNLLAEKAAFPYLLFMDCDVYPETGEFISKYIKAIHKNCVVYGGRSYSPDPPEEDKYYFHWLYGSKREITPVKERQIHPYRSFMTNNFLIPAVVYSEIKMNEDIRGYGHEDTLFGYELKKRMICVKHIDNPLRHTGLETVAEFLDKTRNGVRNFYQLIQMKKGVADTKLYRAYRLVKWTGIKKLFMKWFCRNESRLVSNLHSSSPSLIKFDLLKLGWLLREESNYCDHPEK